MASTASATPAGRSDGERSSPAPETVLELLTDEYARALVDALQDGPRPARELVGECDGSRPTVYRRLNRLEAAGLVAARTVPHPEGHHRKEFRATVEAVSVEFGGGEDGVAVTVDGAE
jgi:DNA-binding HxlR family transcriptional regulator